jgi:hypothetical protein
MTIMRVREVNVRTTHHCCHSGGVLGGRTTPEGRGSNSLDGTFMLPQ